MGRSTARFWSFSSGLVFLAAVALVLGGCNEPSSNSTSSTSGTPAAGATKRIILLINGPSPYWDTGEQGMKLATRDFKLADAGIEAVFQTNDGTEQGQIDALRQYGTQSDIVGIAISPVKANNLAIVEEMRKLQKSGVHVICMDGDVDRVKYRDARMVYIGTDNYKAGEMLGDAAKRLLDVRKAPKGGYVDFVGYRSAQNAIDRMDGIKKTLGQAQPELDRMEDAINRTTAKANVRKAIENYPDLQALLGIWSYNAPMIADVIEKENPKLRKQLTIATFDCEAPALDYMGDGYIDVMMVQNPYDICYQSVRLLKAMATNDAATQKQMFPNLGKAGGDIHDTDIRVVVPDEQSPLKADMFKPYGPTVHFFTLPAFRDWLKQRGLSAS